MQIAVSGSTGLIGSRLLPALGSGGHTVRRLVRGNAAERDEIRWQLATEGGTSDELEGLDAVVHLAGESIAEGRWNAAKKARIRDSRVTGTRLLCERLAACTARPRTLISASAVGIYGDCGDRVCDEKTAAGTDFLADVCREWERATSPAAAAGIRVVQLRTGLVLSRQGGALSKMLLPFRLGLGGRLGTGRHYLSWIAMDDLIRVILFCLDGEQLTGPVNAVAPGSVTNAEFTRALGRVVSRPTLLPMPAFVARLVFGEVADAVLLTSTRAVPAQLEEHGFDFELPEIEGALRHLIQDGS